jgi:peptide/nickel transport system substrate-binding protein
MQSRTEQRTVSRRLGALRGAARLLPALAVAAVSASGLPAASAATSQAASGGTVTQGIIGVAPSYVFPLTPLGAPSSGTNDERFNWLMYLPLYQLSNTAIDTTDSLADPPTWSDGDKTATIKLKSLKWSDGTPVTSRDVAFYFNLVKANKADWRSYTPGEFPDNVASIATPSPSTLVVHLTKAYDPIWYTYDQLATWVALPQQAWDKTSATGAIGNYDETTSGATAVWKFLTSQSANTANYATNPLWKVVDGPWEIKSFESTTGPDVFVPNPEYPVHPKISEFVETIYATDTAEFNALLAGNEINIGTIPPEDLPQLSRLSSDYNLTTSPLWHIGFDNINFRNPVTGPIVSQLYIRQVLAHLNDETGQANAFLDHEKAGYPTYGPIPPQPPSPYASPVQATDPYPFSISTARNLLTSHGWVIPSSGAASCQKPGTGPGECGAGIAKGAKLDFNFEYDTGQAFLDSEVANFQSDAAQAGIVLNVSSAPFQTVVATLTGCVYTTTCAANSWQLGTWDAEGYSGGGSSPYPSATFVGGETNFPSTVLPGLVNATETSPNPKSAMQAYDAYVAKNLPVIFTLTTYGLNVVSKNLQGVQFPASGFENTADWSFS